MKTKLTKEIIGEISKRLKVGCYAKIAAAAIGVPERSYYNWLERGQKAEKLAESVKKIPETEKIFWQFWQSVQQAEAEANIILTTMVFSKGNEDWKAALEMLARKWPEDWARKDYVDFKGSVDRGPDKAQEARDEIEEMFPGVSNADMSKIAMEMTQRLREAKNEALKKKALQNKQLRAPD
jgi:disulfide oxidoreductase YuzD